MLLLSQTGIDVWIVPVSYPRTPAHFLPLRGAFHFTPYPHPGLNFL